MEELEAFISFRLKLLNNQAALDKLNEEFKSLPPESDAKVENEEFIIDLNENDPEEEMEIEYLEEHISEIDEHLGIQEQQLQCEESKCESETEELDSSKRKYQRKRLKDPIKCPKCCKMFFYKSYFAFHYKDVHSQDRCEVCYHCGRQFKNSRRLNSHMLTHNTGEKKFKCEKCGKEFNYSGDLLRHKRMHDNIKPYICSFENCNKAFVQSYALKCKYSLTC
jgi:Zinc finger, C2H2 type